MLKNIFRKKYKKINHYRVIKQRSNIEQDIKIIRSKLNKHLAFIANLRNELEENEEITQKLIQELSILEHEKNSKITNIVSF